MDKIPLINPSLIKVISPAVDQKTTPILSAEVISSSPIKISNENKSDSPRENKAEGKNPNTNESDNKAKSSTETKAENKTQDKTDVKNEAKAEAKIEYRVTLKIDQKLIETISQTDLKKGSQLEVKVLPGPELKIITPESKALNSSAHSISNAAPSPANKTTSTPSHLIQQILADRIPQIKQQDLPNLIKQLALLTQQPTNPSSSTAQTSPSLLTSLQEKPGTPELPHTAPSAKLTTQQANANQLYQQLQPLLKSSPLMSSPLQSSASTQNSANQALTNHVASGELSKTQQQIKSWIASLPSNADISTETGLKNALNNVGIRAESQISQLAQQAMAVPVKSSNSIFKQLQSLNSLPPTSTSTSNASASIGSGAINNGANNGAVSNEIINKPTEKIDLSAIVKSTAKALSENTQQVLSSLTSHKSLSSILSKTNSQAPLASTPAANASITASSSVAVSASLTTNWQNPLLNSSAYPSLEALLQDPLLQSPSSNNKLALAQLLHSFSDSNEQTVRIPMNWPERQGNEAQMLRNLQNLLGHIEREQVQQRSLMDDNPNNQPLTQNHQQWLPLLINHNHQLQLIEFYIDKETKNDSNGEKKQHWFINLHFELPQLGKLGIEISMFENECTTTFWSESAMTLNQLSQNIKPLRQRLTEQGIIVNDIQSKHGILAKSQNNIQQRLVDVKT